MRDDEATYARVMEDLQRSGPVPGLWAKVFEEADGDERVSRARYLRLRAAQLRRQDKESAARLKAEVRLAARLERTRTVGASYTALYVVIGFIVIVTALSGILASIYL